MSGCESGRLQRFVIPAKAGIHVRGALLYGWLPNNQVVAVAAIVGVLPAVALSSGFLATVIAVTTAPGLPIALEMTVVGGLFRVPELIAFALLATPGVAAWFAMRH